MHFENPDFSEFSPQKILLVLFGDLVKVTPTMKRIYTLIVLLGLAMGMMLTGCGEKPAGTDAASTNTPPAAPSTNK
jgi:hypothetical protein